MSQETDQTMKPVVEKTASHTAYDPEAAQLGAALLEEERALTMMQSVKRHWRPLLYCSVSFTAAMMFGYDGMANGASLSMPAFLYYFGDMSDTGPYLPSVWTSLWSAMSSGAQAIGAFFVGFFMDRFGRKYVGVAFSALTLAGTAIQYTSEARGALLTGKMVAGVGVGAAMAVGTTYSSEVAPLKLRAPIQQGIILFTVFMFGLALGIIRIWVPDVEPKAFRIVFAIQWAVGGIATIAWLVVPESPVYLLTKNRIDAASKAMAKLYGSDNKIETRIDILIKTIREEQAQKKLEAGSYLDCFRGTDLKRTLTVIFIYTAVNWGGAALLAQNILILLMAGLPAIHVYDVGIGGFALALIMIVVSWLMIERFRRHNAFLLGCIVNLLCTTVIGALYYAPGTAGLWAAGVLMNLLIAFQCVLIQAMGYPIAAEVSSYRLRGKSMSIATISQALTNWLTAFVVPYMYNVDSGNLGIRTSFVWAGFSVFLVIGAWFLVPDTTYLSAEEIDWLYVHNTKPRDFQKARSLFVAEAGNKAASCTYHEFV